MLPSSCNSRNSAKTKALSYETVDWDELNKEMAEDFGCRLDHCEIDIDTLLDPLSPDGTATVVNLSSLDALKVAYDTFLPENIYVRSNVRQIFALFSKDAAAAGHDERKAANAYWLCRGNIRDALQACIPHGVGLVKNVLDHVVTFTPAAKGKLAMRGHSPRYDEADCVRTLFRTEEWFGRMIEVHTIHIVDPRFIFGRLRKSLDLETIRHCFELARHLNNSAIHGMYVENIIHIWFEKTKPAPIEDVYWSPGAAPEGALEVVNRNVYWIQGSCDFPFITSWVIVGETLCLLHVTVRQRLDLNFQVSIEEFVSSVEKSVAFGKVSLYVLVPASFTEALVLPAPGFRSTSRPMQFKSFRHDVDIASYGRIQLPFLNPHCLR
jgi:hypothetical protein